VGGRSRFRAAGVGDGAQGARACVRSAMPGTLGGSNAAEMGGPMTPTCAVDACGAQ